MTTEQLKAKADGWYMVLNVTGFFAICSMAFSPFLPVLMIVSGLATTSMFYSGVRANDWNERYLNSI